MKKNTLITFGEAIRTKYESEKKNDATGFLYNPTPASLKQLCLLLFDDLNKDDLDSYNRFFILKDVANPRRHIENFETDKFRPLRNFLIRSSEKSSQNNLDLLAVMVNLNPRPFREFIKDENHVSENTGNIYNIDDLKSTDTIVSEPTIVEYGNNEVEVQTESAYDEVEELTTKLDEEKVSDEQNISSPNAVESSYVPAVRSIKNFTLKANRINLVLFILVIISIGFIIKTIFFNEEGCMVWKDDHWEAISCETEVKSFVDMPIVHLDKVRLERQRKIIATDTTTFFRNGKPVVWYYKTPDGTIEYFSYPGLHPVTGETLKKISHIIIDKYVITKKHSDKN